MGTKVGMGVVCRRCGGTSTVSIDPQFGYVPSDVWACPNCFNDDEHTYRLADQYDIVGFKPIDSDEYEPSHGLADHKSSPGSLTGHQYEDFIAVRCRGKSYDERANERRVNRATIRHSVAQAVDKLTEVNDR